MDYTVLDNPGAALELDEEIEAKTNAMVNQPRLYKPGRMKGTWEMVIRPNDVVVYCETPAEVTILRALLAAQQWPSNLKE
jgi:toxin ParE1/3/4